MEQKDLYIENLTDVYNTSIKENEIFKEKIKKLEENNDFLSVEKLKLNL